MSDLLQKVTSRKLATVAAAEATGLYLATQAQGWPQVALFGLTAALLAVYAIVQGTNDRFQQQ